MKKLLAVLIFGFAVAFNSFSAPTSAEQLRSEFEAALKAKDTNAIASLFNWQGVPDDLKVMTTSTVTEMVKHEIADVKLLSLPASYQPTNEMDGVRYFPNVNVVGMIDVEFTQKTQWMQLPYGERAGAFYIAGTEKETFDAHAKSTPLDVMVTGLFPKEYPGILNCSYVYVSAGNERTGRVQFTNTWSTSFFGDYIKSCKVTKISGSGSYELEIHEGTNTVFDSDMVETNDSISYEKKN